MTIININTIMIIITIVIIITSKIYLSAGLLQSHHSTPCGTGVRRSPRNCESRVEGSGNPESTPHLGGLHYPAGPTKTGTCLSADWACWVLWRRVGETRGGREGVVTVTGDGDKSFSQKHK